MSTAAVSAAASGTSNGLVYVMAMIASGTLNTVFSKMQYGVRSEGVELCVDPQDSTKVTTLCAFDKPWFGALLAKIGMTLSLVYLGLRRLQQKKRSAAEATESSSLLPPDGTTLRSSICERLPLKTIVTIAWPSLLDLLQTLISNVGLLWVSSSVYQMARGSVIVFSALVSVHFLHKRLHAYHYASIAMVCVAVVLVGWAGTPHDDPLESSSSFSTSPSSTHAVLGLSLIVMAQLITAVQIVAEEYIMTQLHVEPLLLVGVEGLWGLLFYVFLIPLLTLTPAGNGDVTATALAKIWHEDFADSLTKISQSSTLVVLSLLNIAAVAALGPSANYVTKHLSGVMRSIAEVLRTLGVWLAGLFVFYAIGWRGVGSPGEAWTVYSWMELLGFICMVYGTLAFKKIIHIPFPVLYANADDAKQFVPPSLSTQEPAFA